MFHSIRPFGCNPPGTSALVYFAVLLICSVAAPGSGRHEKSLRPGTQLGEQLSGITADNLRADLSFLSSDALGGRDTPSAGLDVAAEFIASRFRVAGLEAPLNGSYFQDADLTSTAKEVAKYYHYELPRDRYFGRNVIGILRGSDERLRNTYVIVSAHYDHIGTTETAGRRAPKKETDASDHVYNGANDDGSGTVSVIALAEAFGKLGKRPKRSIVFITFCGEELGLLGSKYYVEHPVVPLKDTIGEINLEQIGRSDGDVPKGSASLTGFEFTTIGDLFRRAGRSYAIRVYQDPNANKYFQASDNLNFALHGIPDATLCTAFEFEDYHGLKDEWQKIDYSNMAMVDRVVGTVVGAMANSRNPPEWIELHATESYRKASRQLHGD